MIRIDLDNPIGVLIAAVILTLMACGIVYVIFDALVGKIILPIMRVPKEERENHVLNKITMAIAGLVALAGVVMMVLPILGIDTGPLNLLNILEMFQEGKRCEGYHKTRGYFYIPFSYFNGATVANEYKPSTPYNITIYETPYTDLFGYTGIVGNKGYYEYYCKSDGVGSLIRKVRVRQAANGNYYLIDEYLLAEIKAPASSSPW